MPSNPFLLINANDLATQIQRAGLQRGVTMDKTLSELSEEVAEYKRSCKLTYKALDILEDLISARKMSYAMTSQTNDKIAEQLASMQDD